MRRGFWAIGAACLFYALALVPAGQARDLQGRLGLGYNSEFASSQATGGTPAISLKYGLTRDLAASLLLGMKTGSPNSSVIGGKFFKNLFIETNLNFYFTAGLAMESISGSSGVELLSGFGAEFFIPGVESLGFSVETGASYSSLGGHSTLKTIGVSFLDAGIHFYF